MKFLFLCIFLMASSVYAQNQKADFECFVGLIEIDKSSQWNIGGVEATSTEVLQSGVDKDGNKILSLKHYFKKQQMTVYTTINSSDLAEPEFFWSDLTATLVKKTGNKTSVLSSLQVSHSKGDAANTEVILTNRLFMDKISHIPGALSGTADESKILAALDDGDILGAIVNCERVK